MSATQESVPGPHRAWRLDNAILSVSIVLATFAPLYNWADPSSHAQLIFPILGGLLLMLLGRYKFATMLIVVGLLFYTSLIVLANGVESVRLGVVSAIFLGLLFSTARASPMALWASVLYVAYLLYVHTEGFASIIWTPVTENMSHNYFSQALCYVLMATMLSGTQKRAKYLAVAILVTSTVAAAFIPSRQLMLVGAFAAIYLLVTGRRAVGTMILLCSVVLISGYLYGYEDIAAINKLLGRGLDSPRATVFDCYVTNLSITDILIGSDHTASGRCALTLLMFRYLHSGYLETVNQLGLLGVVMIMLYPVAVAYFAYRGNYNMVLALILAGIYQIVETGFMWVLFMVLFTCMGEVCKLQSQRLREYGAQRLSRT